MRKFFVLLFLTLMVFGYSAGASADSKKSGQGLYKKCKLGLKVNTSAKLTNTQIVEGVSCLSMMKGIKLINRMEQEMGNKELLFCLPEGKSNAQLTRTVVRYLKNYPKWRSSTDSELIVTIFKDKFPCKKH